MMFILQNLSYIHPNKDLLFENISLSVADHEKIALIGNNGTGKSTLLKIIAGELNASGGQLHVDAEPYYVPQVFGQYNQLTVAQALKADLKLQALKEILKGNAEEENFTQLNDDWTIEDRCREALAYWQSDDVDLSQPMDTLSGGQKTKVFLAGISIHEPKLILMDEPTNHLDGSSRQHLYDLIQSTNSALVVVSHDRQLLRRIDKMCELSRVGIKVYGDNYDFYVEQKKVEDNALSQEIHSKEKALKRAREKERESIGRQQRLDSRGKGKQAKAGVARIMMNTLRNNSENSTSRLKRVHEEKVGDISKELTDLRSALPDIDKMKFGLDNSMLHKGKILFSGTGINFSYGKEFVWKKNLDLQLLSGERIVLKGNNGSGKTTLLKLIVGNLQPTKGIVHRADNKVVYIDQDYSVLNDRLKVYEQAQQFNLSSLQSHEVKTRLDRFLFPKKDWDNLCGTLSGGERMRLLLCCLTIDARSPDMIILDEPTNNLDIQNIKMLTAAINEYQGTLIVVSHDEDLLEQININKKVLLGE